MKVQARNGEGGWVMNTIIEITKSIFYIIHIEGCGE